LISRANEQIKVDICYNNTNVKLFGLNTGASYGPLASTTTASTIFPCSVVLATSFTPPPAR
jgi:transketolase C-terminal domain/subunit